MEGDQQRTESQLWGRRVFFILLGAFGVILGVDVVMISLAVGTFSGTTTVNPYEQGLAYNSTLAEKQKERTLGWAAVRVREVFPKVLRYMVAGKDGNPLTGASVVAALTRPVGNGAGENVVLNEVQSGVYEAQIAWPGKGQWDISTEVRKGEDRFTMDERVMVR